MMHSHQHEKFISRVRGFVAITVADSAASWSMGQNPNAAVFSRAGEVMAAVQIAALTDGSTEMLLERVARLTS